MRNSSLSSNSIQKVTGEETKVDEVLKTDEVLKADEVLEEDLGFKILKKIITENTGFNCEYYKEAHFRRRINVRVRATNSDSYEAYLKFLKKDPGEYRFLVETLTVNVSEFFRNPETFKIIEKEIIPYIVRYKSKLVIRPIRIWSAGCATGEEAYSLAILLHRILKKDFNKYRITITGTDIDTESLNKARKGLYSENSLKNIDINIKENYFLKQGEDYQIIDQLKDIIHFKRHDLLSGPKLNNFDFIVCRNVMIYFKKEVQEQLQLNFYQALEKGGVFAIGKAETLLGTASYLFKPYNSRERLYMKESLIETHGKDQSLKRLKD